MIAPGQPVRADRLSDVIRRSPLRLTAVAATIVTVLSGCATFSDADVVAQVGDDDISNDDFEVLADEFFAAPDVFGTTPSIGGRVDAEQSRSLLGAMVRQQIVDQFLDQQGIDATEIRETHKSTVLAPSPVGALSERACKT